MKKWALIFICLIFVSVFSFGQLPPVTIRKTVYTDTNGLILNTGELSYSNNFSVYIAPTLSNHVVRLIDLINATNTFALIDTSANYTWTGTNSFQNYALFGNGSSINQGVAGGLVITNSDGLGITNLNSVNLIGGVNGNILIGNSSGSFNSVSTNGLFSGGMAFLASNQTFSASNTFSGVIIGNGAGLTNISLTSGISGILPIANGGTAASSATNAAKNVGVYVLPGVTSIGGVTPSFNGQLGLTSDAIMVRSTNTGVGAWSKRFIFDDQIQIGTIRTTDPALILNNVNPGGNVQQVQNLSTNGYSAIAFINNNTVERSAFGYGNSNSASVFAAKAFWETSDNTSTPSDMTIIQSGVYNGLAFTSYPRMTYKASDQSFRFYGYNGTGAPPEVLTIASNGLMVASNSITSTIGFIGNGSGLTNLNATSLLSGTIPTARYGAEVVLTNMSPIHIGSGTYTTNDSLAIGMLGTYCDSTNSVAVGNTVSANGVGSSAFGVGSFTFGANKGTALGYSAQCYGPSGVAVGNQSGAYAQNSMAFGNLCSAINIGSIAIGKGAKATNDNAIVISNNETDTGSQGSNTFAVYSSGGYYFLAGGIINGNGIGVTNLNSTNLIGGVTGDILIGNSSGTYNLVSTNGLFSGGGGSGTLTNFASNVPWLTGSGSAAAATVSTNATKIPINVNTDNNAIGLTNFSANIVQTNNSVFVNAITNVVSTGSGTGLVSSVSGGIASIASLIPGANITFTRSGTTNLTIASTASGGLTSVTNTHSIKMFFDGGGSPIIVGTKRFTYVPYNGTIIGATMIADQTGYLTVDVLKTNYPNYIVTAPSIAASALPNISNAIKSQDTTLTGWGTSVVSNDCFGFNVTVSTNITWGELTLTVREVLP